MGMSSSQARLLSLTARQHDIEYKAQRLEAQKLQMSNESDSVYNDYLKAMDATKIQTKLSSVWDDNGFVDATLNVMENQGVSSYTGKTASKNLFLEEISTGRIFITKQFADQNGLTTTDAMPSLDDFLTSCGHTKTSYPVYSTRTVENLDTVAGFTPITSSSLSSYSETWGYSKAVANTAGGGIDYAALAAYASFNSAHSAVSGTALTPDISALTSGSTYTISDATQLKKLQELVNSGVSTANVTIKLANNIDMSSVSDWSGIGYGSKNSTGDNAFTGMAFKGTFDGNGYTINNLTGTQGLFGFTEGATVENVGLENLKINGSSGTIGGLIGYATDTNVSNVYSTGSVNNTNTTSFTHTSTAYDNAVGTGGLVGFYYGNLGATTTVNDVYSSANVTGAGYNVGGLLGTYFIMHGNSHPNFENAYSTGAVNGSNNVGGIAGYWKVDPDNNSNTTVSNLYSGGTITGNTNVGGFTGVLSCWDDNGDSFTFTGIDTTSKINGTNNSGVFIGNNNAVTTTTNAQFTDSGYGEDINPGMNMVGAATSGTASIPSTGGGVEPFNVAPTVPSVSAGGTGGLYSNIYAAMIKAGSIKPTDMAPADLTAVQNKIKAFITSFGDNATDNAKLYNLNTNIYKALTDSTLDSSDTTFMSQLTSDINNGTTTNTATYQNTGLSASDKVARSNTNDAWSPDHSLTKGTMSIPSIKTIATELALAFKKAGYTPTDIASNIESYLTSNYSDTSDSTAGTINKAYLAELNKIAGDNSTKGVDADSDLSALYNAYSGNSKYTAKAIDQDVLDHPDRYQITMSTADQSSAVTGSIQHGTKEETYQSGTKLDWDQTDTSILADEASYNLLKNSGFIVENETISSSNTWLTNVVNAGVAQFTTFDLTTGAKTSASVATETSLQEVSDDTFLKKAEAKYEADMRKINSKETRIDNDLSKLETERTAIKTEEDTLKTTIKDNVNLNFKLFS